MFIEIKSIYKVLLKSIHLIYHNLCTKFQGNDKSL